MEVTQQAVKKMLLAHPMFRGLEQKEAQALAECCQILRARKGQVVFRQHAPTKDLYVVLSGRLRLTHRNPEGIAVTTAIIKEGSLLGEVGFLDEQPRSATSTAITHAFLLRMIDAKVLALVETNRPAAHNLMRWLREEICRRGRGLNHRLDSVFSPDASGEDW